MNIFRNMLFISIINYITLFFITRILPPIVPIHVNLYRVIDGFGSKWMIMLFGLLPVIATAGMMLYRYMTKNNTAIARNENVENIILASVMVFLTAVTWLPVLVAFQYDVPPSTPINVPIESVIVFPIGVLFIIISNFMGVLKQNRYVGIRVPWTLKNQEVWKRTHRLGGYTGVAGGIIMCVCSGLGFAFDAPVLSIAGLIVGVLLGSLVPVIYSYVIYRRVEGQLK